jgi:uncharacterized repeat protein (TIGR01451 family)
MAGPHVAGLAALLISANPALAGQVDALENIIEQSAVPLTNGDSCGGTAGQVPNNTYGWGRIDAWKALTNLSRIILTKTVSSSEIRAGEILTYTLITNHSPRAEIDHHVMVTDTLPASTTLITATLPYTFDSGVVRWEFPSLEADESLNMQLVVQVPLTATLAIENKAYGAASDETTSPAPPPVITQVLPAYDMDLTPSVTGLGWPGRNLIYRYTLVNKGFLPDSYDLSFESSLGWAVLSSPTAVTLEPGAAAELVVQVAIPAEAALGQVDTIRIAAVSRGNPDRSASIISTTTVGYRAHFPLIFKP